MHGSTSRGRQKKSKKWERNPGRSEEIGVDCKESFVAVVQVDMIRDGFIVHINMMILLVCQCFSQGLLFFAYPSSKCQTSQTSVITVSINAYR